MKRKFYTLLFVLFTFQLVSAQNQANIWYFRDYCGLDFNSGVPVNTDEIIIGSMNAMSVMCDTNSDFLFCCNGEKIVNRNGTYIVKVITDTETITSIVNIIK